MQSSSRNGARVRVLAVHTTEGIMRAAALRDWTSWAGSSHASADETGALLTPADGFVPYDRAAWTLRSGNPWSENIELCGYAKWKRGDWLARPRLLDACARWLADRSKARGIPLVKLSAKDYAKGGSGVIGHHDHTVGYSDGTHWDPGPGFPFDIVLEKARAYAGGTPTPAQEDDMYGPEQRYEVVSALTEITGNTRSTNSAVAGMAVQLAQVAAAVQQKPVDVKALAAEITPVLVPAVVSAVGEKVGLTEEDVEDVIRRVLGGLDGVTSA